MLLRRSEERNSCLTVGCGPQHQKPILLLCVRVEHSKPFHFKPTIHAGSMTRIPDSKTLHEKYNAKQKKKKSKFTWQVRPKLWLIRHCDVVKTWMEQGCKCWCIGPTVNNCYTHTHTLSCMHFKCSVRVCDPLWPKTNKKILHPKINIHFSKIFQIKNWYRNKILFSVNVLKEDYYNFVKNLSVRAFLRSTLCTSDNLFLYYLTSGELNY